MLSRMQFVCLSSHLYAPSDALPMYQILKQSDNWLWRYCISKILGCRKCRHESRCSSALIVSNFNSNVPRGGGGGIYPHMKLYNNVLGIYNVMPL